MVRVDTLLCFLLHAVFNLSYPLCFVNYFFSFCSSDEQNIFRLYKARLLGFSTRYIWLFVLKKPELPLFSLYAPFFSPYLPSSLPFFSCTQISLVFFSPILIYFLLSYCFSTHWAGAGAFASCSVLLSSTTPPMLLWSVRSCALSVLDNNGSSSPDNHGWTGVPDNTPVFSVYWTLRFLFSISIFLVPLFLLHFSP